MFKTINPLIKRFVGIALCFVLLTISSPASAFASTTFNLNRSVSGWIPYWDQAQALSVVQNNLDTFNEMTPFWYDVTSTGTLTALTNSENSTLISFAQTNGRTLTPLISNEYNGTTVSTIINSPAVVQSHITNIVNKVVSMGYSGIEIDYENISSTDHSAFTSFVQNLGTQLHANGKTLMLCVPAKTISTSYTAYDYVALGQAVDKMRIMAYDYSWSGSIAGSIAPYSWVNNVLLYAITAIPPSKIELGVPDYGYDWVGTSGKGVTYSQAINTANTYGAQITDDAQNGPHYSYTVNGISHTVWFEDSTSVNTLLDLVNKYNINGISIWRLGGEDSNIYPAIRTKFALAVTTPSPAPVVDLTSPTVSLSYTIDKKGSTMKASAQDNVGVTKVQFYYDSKLVGTDTSSPYSVYYQVKKTNQTHTMSAIAYDAAGNSSTSQVSVRY
ncbi:glycosyl hydrolase family 18 protein [Desulfosporosinus sp. Sb-LF]|uniref:glycosyl hydrolase family 18 protein n=1 Tax=Desulfosporosinus sp. Sb-LF TaxID=2560027 RepID=UPI00107F50A4|nr:glycosyl hydrolase family 18 protein [Desulfosporosinus sp. Sb-LF]TGE33490.1 hypothetical protein E4K68_04895 [Desulfosporosinus sp. Sb-LF]